jgi:hypothetical protein
MIRSISAAAVLGVFLSRGLVVSLKACFRMFGLETVLGAQDGGPVGGPAAALPEHAQ